MHGVIPWEACCRIELRTGDLLIFPSWVQTSILVLPPAANAARSGNQPAPVNRVAQADAASLDLGFAPGFGAADAPPPPRSAAASVMHLALPGFPPATASAVLPLRIPMAPPATPRRALQGDPPADADAGTCDTFDYLWYMYGSPVSVHNLEDVDPTLDLVQLRQLALAAFEAFRRCFPKDGNDDDHEYPGSLGDDLFAYQSHWPNTREYPCTGGLDGQAATDREEAWQRAFATYVMGAMHKRMLTAGASPAPVQCDTLNKTRSGRPVRLHPCRCRHACTLVLGWAFRVGPGPASVAHGRSTDAAEPQGRWCRLCHHRR